MSSRSEMISLILATRCSLLFWCMWLLKEYCTLSSTLSHKKEAAMVARRTTLVTVPCWWDGTSDR